eukprot:247483-Karenia_brevis.AAC.1
MPSIPVPASSTPPEIACSLHELQTWNWHCGSRHMNLIVLGAMLNPQPAHSMPFVKSLLVSGRLHAHVKVVVIIVTVTYLPR